VRDPVVDELAAAIPEAKTREELVATTRALDRVLLFGHYVVPFYHLGADLIAWWPSHVAHPDVTPLYGPILEAWWAKP
jgi:microcin C transport system substrate-binding protein